MAVFNFDLFLDCGAPSLYNSLSQKIKSKNKRIMGSGIEGRKYDDYSYVETTEYQKYKQGYIDFIKHNKSQIETYSNLDVINNIDFTLQNQKDMESAGLGPIPVWHYGSEKDDKPTLRHYVENYDYIAIGGITPNTPKGIYRGLDSIFDEYLTDDKGFPKVKVHGFGLTTWRLVSRYPWFSVDSTVCSKSAVYGKILFPNIYSMDCFFDPIIYTVSDRDAPLKDRYGERGLKEIEKRLEQYGFTVEEASKIRTVRRVMNTIYYRDFIRNVIPNWPWSFDTRKEKKGADKKVRFYTAGALSKKEEEHFWQELDRVIDKEDTFLRYRLHSYFYKTQVEYLLAKMEE